MDTFEHSNLWQKNLANQGDNDPYEAARERLRQAFIRTRSAVKPLVDQIAKELSYLTVHDITHLDNLWHIADVLMGTEYDINPAETFVLGMAFLLHDTACSSFAFPKGIDSLRETLEWQDFVAQNGFSEDEMKKGELGFQRALFETLRLLHSRQAENLLSQSWPDLNDQPRYLMEDVELRNHYGRDIGKIAASHGKDAAIAEQEWANAAPLSLHSSLGLNANAVWKVDRLKLAMLIRCIDAAHIDSRRAPDMLASISQPKDVSRKHWQFQNRLGAIAINSQDEIYWSGQTFEEKDSDAWWLCYDTAKMIDHEIRIANRILKSNSRRELCVKGVAGAQDISVFIQNVPVQGWSPVDVKFQIRDVGDVIEKFGGEKLYGDKPYLALRELIQNAADAIRARRLYRNKPEHGRIEISLTEEKGAWWIHVQDDGIGMSRYVLTDVLLDFGRSLWRDSALREQWSGLARKGFDAVGQFGIGFFSVFMLGDEIKVTTWRDGDAESNQVTLHLRNRTNNRPILLDTPKELRLNEPGSCVSVRLKSGRASLLKEFYPKNSWWVSSNTPSQEMTLSQTVGILAPALDIDVWCKDGLTEKLKVIEANDWEKLSSIDLLHRLAPIYTKTFLAEHIKSLCNICESDGTIVGRASLDLSGGHTSFGGNLGVLVHKGISMATCDLCGILLSSNNRDLARNYARPICSADALINWAYEIHSKFNGTLDTSSSQKFLSLGLPSKNLPLAKLADNYVTPEEIKRYLKEEGVVEILFISNLPECPDTFASRDFYDNFKLNDDVFVVENIGDPRIKFGLGDWISFLIPATPKDPRDIRSAIEQCIKEVWPDATFVQQRRVIGYALGEDIDEYCLVCSEI